jgi:hypothetical protein
LTAKNNFGDIGMKFYTLYAFLIFIPVITIRFILGGIDAVFDIRTIPKFEKFITNVTLKIFPNIWVNP